jgi:hypothetical protein
MQSVKGPDNTFNVNPKWARTLPYLIYFSEDIYRDPASKKKSNIKVYIWHPAVGLRCRNPHRHFSQIKAGPIHLIETPSAPQAHSRVSNINFDFWIFFCGGYLYNYLMKHILRTQSSCPLGVSIKWIGPAFIWLKCLCGFLHLKQTHPCTYVS